MNDELLASTEATRNSSPNLRSLIVGESLPSKKADSGFDPLRERRRRSKH